MKFIFFLIFSLTILTLAVASRAPARFQRVACPIPGEIPNGNYRLRRNQLLMRVSCKQGFTLQGPRIIDCLHGKWQGQKPVCAKAGCGLNEPHPEHGQIQYDSPYRMILFCNDNYKLAGNRFAYCNGTDWDRPIGNCREPNFMVEHECDFETDDICGWVYEEGAGTTWRRVTAMNIYNHFQTGPRHDHTFTSLNGGHYMLMETIDSSSEPGYLLSPIYDRDSSLKTACCFRFYYFMYGSGVGELKIYVRPISMEISDMLAQSEEYIKFHKAGNQNNIWNEAHFSISELNNDFQIVIVATAGKNHLSDIAIDDVKLMTGEDCTALDEDNSASVEDEVTEEIVFDTQSCANRCFEDSGAGIVRRKGKLFGYCDCNLECEEEDNCCPDFRMRCLDVIFAQSTQISDEISQSVEGDDKETTRHYMTIPPIMPTTTTTTTTTTKRAPTTTTTKRATTTTSTTTTTKIPKFITRTPMPNTTTTSTTIPKPTIKFTTPIKSTTTTTKYTTTTTTPKTLTTTTRTTTERTTPKSFPTKRRIPNPNFTNGTQAPIKQDIISWKVDGNNAKKRDNGMPHTGRIMLTIFIIIVGAILLISLIYRFKNQIKGFMGGTDNGGDVETTSIRTKFLFKPKYRKRNSNHHDDIDDLLEDDEVGENEANFGIDNKLTITKQTIKTETKNSLSTNL